MNYIPNAISVVIPTYNRAHLIRESIQSVLDQTLLPQEIIIVDDFSTDNTEEVVNSFNSPLIKFVKNQRKKGANGARNTGILMAQGEYIAFHDSDDIWYEEKLFEQLNILKNDDKIDLCFCSMKTTGRWNRKIIVPKAKVSIEKIYDKIEKYSFISTQTIFVRSCIAMEVMFDEEIKRLQDWDFILRLRRKNNIFHLNKVLVDQNIGDMSISKQSDPIEAYKNIFEKYPFLINNGLQNIFFKNRISYRNNKNIVLFLKILFLKMLLSIKSW
ncbi:hypothetical protein GCM10023345_17390 [Acinetobacter kookii]|uniref:Glycosyltransferase involved in cell wall bisynthesis n=1 Tax=Acinetobacter kookii TaxID=1226327 RepID=A0A1G6M1G2_9GAMM|nr:glycosyltransferase family 2 protein [Acinetobacter kookii]SDC48786.1 Glycosyltransferase involved in cell wall bisynthesis [Acinetobacter kookii]